MTKKVYIFVANGTEETEAVGTYDTLKRGGIDAYFVSINPTKEFTSSHGLQLTAHFTIDEVKDEVVDAVAMPGGMPGATNLYECELLREIITRHLAAGKHIAAMCASPLVFGRMGLLEEKKATAYPGFEKELKGRSTRRNQPLLMVRSSRAVGQAMFSTSVPPLWVSSLGTIRP